MPRGYQLRSVDSSEEFVRNSSGTTRLVSDYNPRVFRRLTATVLVVLVQSGAIAAPLMHVHLDDVETAHHHGQSLHAHLSGHHDVGHSRPGPIADHQDEAGRTVSAQIYLAAASEPFSLPVLPSPSFALIVPVAQATGRTPHVAHAHDPPSIGIRSSRAPPAFLS